MSWITLAGDWFRYLGYGALVVLPVLGWFYLAPYVPTKVRTIIFGVLALIGLMGLGYAHGTHKAHLLETERMQALIDNANANLQAAADANKKCIADVTEANLSVRKYGEAVNAAHKRTQEAKKQQEKIAQEANAKLQAVLDFRPTGQTQGERCVQMLDYIWTQK